MILRDRFKGGSGLSGIQDQVIEINEAGQSDKL
jgi:hypothetical protein